MVPTVDTRSIRRRRHSRSRSIPPSTPTIPSRISPHSSQMQALHTTQASLAAHIPRSTPARLTTRPDDSPSAQSPLCRPLVCLQSRRHTVQTPIPTPRQAIRRASKSHPPRSRPMVPPLLLRLHTRLVFLVISIRPPLALPLPWPLLRTRCILPTSSSLGPPSSSSRSHSPAQARPAAMVLPSNRSSNTIFPRIRPWPSNPLHQRQNARRAASSGSGTRTIYDQCMRLHLLEWARQTQMSVCTTPGLLLRPLADPSGSCPASPSAYGEYLTDVQHL